MKVYSLLAALLLAFCVTPARAQQGPDDDFVSIYGLIQKADALVDAGQPRDGLADYTTAQAALDRFAHAYPEWNPNIITFRKQYLMDKIASTTALLPAPATAAPALPAANVKLTVDDQMNALRQQVENLQGANNDLAAKLKEALAAQPAVVDPRELATDQEKIVALMKENDLLKASLATRKAPATTSSPEKLSRSEARKQIDQLEEKVKTLEARLKVDEATAVPYTPEELALFQPPATVPTETAATATSTASPARVDNQAPPGTDEQVSSAKTHFANHEYELAAADYRKMLQADPNNAYALANLAAMELQQDRLADAEKHVQGAFAQNPHDPLTLYVLGNLKFRQEKYDDAFETLSEAAALDPQNPTIESLLGVVLGHKGLRAQAETALRKALVLDPNFGGAHYNLAVVYMQENPARPALARWHYLKALGDGEPRRPEFEKLLSANGAPVPAQ